MDLVRLASMADGAAYSRKNVAEAQIIGLNCGPPKKYLYVLTPRTCRCDLFLEKGSLQIN